MTVDERRQVIVYCLFFVAVLLIVFVAWWIHSYFEAAAFNRLTGKTVSTWDAMFVQFIVYERVE